MRKLKFLISLMTNENDFQLEQAHSAEVTAAKLGVDIDILYAENDAITQSTQILKVIQSAAKDRPDGIVFEPVGGTALPQVAKAAITAGIGWAVLNRDASYVAELRRTSQVPIFGVSSDQLEVGRICGRQCAALLPRGGSILYIEGPSQSSVSREREMGMQEMKPANIHVSVLKGQWTEESARRAVSSWLKLSTSQKATIDLIVAQNDAMAIGARKAFQEVANESERDRWLSIPFLGCDGVPKTGQSWVRSGLLIATICVPPNTGRAMEMLADALQNKKMPPERAFTVATSIPPVESLRPAK
jgi:ribose transport system substrate-binding protein